MIRFSNSPSNSSKDIVLVGEAWVSVSGLAVTPPPPLPLTMKTSESLGIGFMGL